MVGLNLDYIRNLNKLKIFKSSNNSAVEEVFSAYLPDGFDLNLSTQNSSFLGGFNLTDNLLASAALNYFGYSTFVDVSRKMICTGSNPIAFKVEAFLILQDSYEKDIQTPLNKLLKHFLPSRGNVLEGFNSRLSTFVSNKKQEATQKQKDSGNPNGTGGIWDLANKSLEFVNSYIGGVYELKQPEGINPETNLIIKFGNHFTYENCYINSLSLKVPKLLMEDGIPDHVKVSLGIETLRVATTDLVKF